MTLTGGLVFWFLLVLLLVALIIFIERFLDLRRSQIDYQDFLKGVINILDTGNETEALAICEETAAPVASIVSIAIRNRQSPLTALKSAIDSQGRAEVGRLDRRLASLAIIGQIAPLLGLLGTLWGFVKAIVALNAQELVSRPQLLSASMESLLSAAFGIAVAIVVTFLYGSLRIRLERLVVELEAAASQILGYLSRDVGEAKGVNA